MYKSAQAACTEMKARGARSWLIFLSCEWLDSSSVTPGLYFWVSSLQPAGRCWAGARRDLPSAEVGSCQTYRGTEKNLEGANTDEEL